MALNLSTPTSQLAWEVATRNQEAQAAAQKYMADRTAMQEAAKLVAPMGGNVEDYAAEFGQSDAAAQRRSQMADLYKNYVIGRPELLQRVAAEDAARRRTGTGGTPMGSATLPFDPIQSANAIMEAIFGKAPSTGTTVRRGGVSGGRVI